MAPHTHDLSPAAKDAWPSYVTNEETWGTPKLYERIVAVVDKDVVTFGELIAEARLALVERHGAAWSETFPDQSFLTSFQGFLVGQMLIAREARRMGSDEVTEEEVDQRVAALRDRFDSMEAYSSYVASLDMGPLFVREVLARNVRNERYTQQRLRTRMLGADLRRRTQATSPGEVRPSSQDKDHESRKAQMLRAWIHDLRQAVDIQVLGEDGVLHADVSR